MNNRGNAGVIALILAALVGITYLPRASRESEAEPAQPVEAQAGLSASPLEAAKPNPSEPCSAIGGLLRRFFPDKKFPDDKEQVPYPDVCYRFGKPPKRASRVAGAPDLKFVIALIPDPLQTHLPLFFDRAVEAIQQAAQDEGYSYDSSWFPWSDERRKYTHLADDLANRDRKRLTEEQPGVMVFRQGLVEPADFAKAYAGGLVVFIVGEQPTRGITDSQFENAMLWLSSLDPSGKQPLRILGPTSSGGLPSLERELEKTWPHWSNRSELQVFSGTVSSPTSFDWFCKSVSQFLNIAKVDKPCIGQSSTTAFEFRTYNESDELKTDRFCRYLDNEHYDLRRLAILSEDQTAFGSAAQSYCTSRGRTYSPISLYYPRDIALLRAAYERQGIFAAGRQAANAPSTTLRGDLTEPASSGSDTVRTYGGQLDSLALESLLQAIAVQLDQHHIQFVLIRSSNSLDRVFLSQFLRRTYPQARIVLDGADLLFLRSGQGSSPRGVMALSTYPLLPQQQRWTRTLRACHNGSYRVFGQDTAEAVYLAARGLLAPPDEKQAKEPFDDPLHLTCNHNEKHAMVPVYDSLPPYWAPVKRVEDKSRDCARTATWLTVIGSGRFWPVAALSGATEIDMRSSGDSLLTPASDPERRAGDDPTPDDVKDGEHLLFPPEMKVLLIICVLMAAWHLYGCWYGSIKGPLRALTYFAPLPRREYSQLVFFGSLVIGLMGAVLAVLSGLSSQVELSSPWLMRMRVTTALMLFSAALSLVGNYSLPRLRGRPEGRDQRLEHKSLWGTLAKRIGYRWRLILFSVVIMVLLVFGYAALLDVYLIRPLTYANRLPTFWRAINLFSFVSPLLPLVLLLFGLRAWFWCNLQGMSLLGEDRPRLPNEEQFRPLPGEPRPIMRIFARAQTQKRVEDQAMPLGVRWLGVFPIFFVTVAGVFRLALHGWGVRSLGEMRFGHVVFWWLVLVTAMLLADLVQMLHTWRCLHRLLVLLDRLRLRRTLAAMKGIAWGSVWKMSGNVLDERYRVITRQIESLGNLHNALQPWLCHSPEEAADKAFMLDRVASCMNAVMEFANWHVSLSDPARIDSFGKCCARLFDRKLVGDLGPIVRLQEQLAFTAGAVMDLVLISEWRKESESLLVDKSRLQPRDAQNANPHRPFAPCAEVSDLVRTAEEFFVLPYLGFIQNTLGRIRTMAFGMLALFVGMTLAVASYPFDPQPVLAGMFLALFVVAGVAVAVVYAGMYRDATLSYVTDTNPGELGWQFWLRLVAFGIGPLLALLATWFPPLTDFLVSWLQPSAQALK